MIGGEGRGQKSNLVTRGCLRADTKKGKNGNDRIKGTGNEKITITTSDVIREPEPEVEVTMTTRSEKKRILMKNIITWLQVGGSVCLDPSG